MPKHAPSASLLVFAFAAGTASFLALLGACTSPDGQTPDCVNNVDSNGVHPNKDGCVQFAKCDKGAPADCCVDDKGDPLTGSDLAYCLYGYGGCAVLLVDDKGNATCSDTYDGGGAGGGGGGGGGTGGGGTGGGGTGGSDGGP
jgi:hypothetical protein